MQQRFWVSSMLLTSEITNFEVRCDLAIVGIWITQHSANEKMPLLSTKQ